MIRTTIWSSVAIFGIWMWTPDLEPYKAAQYASKIIHLTTRPGKMQERKDYSPVINAMRLWLRSHYTDCNDVHILSQPVAPQTSDAQTTKDGGVSQLKKKDDAILNFQREAVDADTRCSTCADMVWFAMACLRCINKQDEKAITAAFNYITYGGWDSTSHAAQPMKDAFKMPTTFDELRAMLRRLCIEWLDTKSDLRDWVRGRLPELEIHAVVLLAGTPHPRPQFDALALCSRTFWNIDIHGYVASMYALHPLVEEKDIRACTQRFTRWTCEQLQYDPGEAFALRYRLWFYQLSMAMGSRAQYVRLNPGRKHDRLDVVWRMNLEDLRVEDKDIDEREKTITETMETEKLLIARDPSHPAHDILCFALFAFMFSQSFHGVDFVKSYVAPADRLHEQLHLVTEPAARVMKQTKGKEPVVMQYRRPVIVISGGEIRLVSERRSFVVPTLKAACIAWILIVTKRYNKLLESGHDITPLAQCCYAT